MVPLPHATDKMRGLTVFLRYKFYQWSDRGNKKQLGQCWEEQGYAKEGLRDV